MEMKSEPTRIADTGRIRCCSTLKPYANADSGGGTSTIPPKGRTRNSEAKIRIKKIP